MSHSAFNDTDIGRIPSDWAVKKLGEVGSVKMCKRIFKHETTAEGDIPFFKIGTFGQIADAFITQEKFESFKSLYPYPRKDTPLISAAGTIGRIVLHEGQDAYYQDSNIVWLEHDEREVLNPYLRYYYSVIKWVTETGSAITRLYNNQLLSALIAVPSIKEQHAIATTLSDMDALIEAKTALLEKKRAIKQGAMQELLTGRRRLPGFPVTLMQHTEIGDIPEDWEVSITKKCLSMPITDGPHETPTLCDDGIPFISAESVSSGNGRIDFSRMRGYISEAYHQECCKKYKPQVNDVYIIKSGSTTGKVAIVKTSQVFNIWSPLAVLRARQSIDPDFLFYSVQSNYYQEQIIQAWGMGTQQNIGMRTLEHLKIAYPEYAEQRAIATALSDIDEEIEGLEHELSKLCNLKQGMMQNLLTGRIRLV